MERIEEFSDERNKAWCIHCGAWMVDADSNLDHAPTKALLNRPLPHHVPQVPVCKACNNGFSLDEAYVVAFISSVISGSTSPEAQVIPAAARILNKSEKLQTRIQQASSVDDAGVIHWQPDGARFERVILKNARGHAFFELGEPMRDEPASVTAVPLETLSPEARSQFENVGWDVWPEVGSRLMTRLCTGEDMVGGWIVIQPGVYRYAVLQDGGIVVRAVIRDYLATETRWD